MGKEREIEAAKRVENVDTLAEPKGDGTGMAHEVDESADEEATADDNVQPELTGLG